MLWLSDCLYHWKQRDLRCVLYLARRTGRPVRQAPQDLALLFPRSPWGLIRVAAVPLLHPRLAGSCPSQGRAKMRTRHGASGASSPQLRSLPPWSARAADVRKRSDAWRKSAGRRVPRSSRGSTRSSSNNSSRAPSQTAPL